MKIKFRLLIIWLFFFISNLVVARDKENIKVQLQLKWTHQFQFAGYYAAKEKGYYSEEGLDVEIMELKNNENPVDIVLSGRADFGIGSSDLIIERAQGKKIVLLASIFQHSPYIFISSKNVGIDNIHQISNKRIAIENHASELLYYLKNGGVKVKDIQQIPYFQGINDLLGNKVDLISAYSTDELYLLNKMGVEYNVFSPRSSGVDFYGDSLFTTEEFIKKNPKVVEKFLNATLKGWKYAIKNKEELVNITKKNYAKTRSKEQLLFEANEMEKLIVPEIVDIGYINKGRWEEIAKAYQKIGLIPEKYSLKGFYYRNIIEMDINDLIKISIISIIFLILLGTIVIMIIVFNVRLNREIKEKNIVESELKISEAKYKLLAENTVECIWLLNLSTMEYKYISPAITYLRGLTVEEAMKETLEDSLTPESLERVYKATELRMGKFMSGDRSPDTIEGTYEFQQYRKDGTIVDVEISTKYVYNEEEKALYIIGVSRDISLRKKLEQKIIEEINEKNVLIEKLSKSEQELKEFFVIIEHSPISVVITDVNGNIKYANKTVLELTGYTIEELIGKNPRVLNSGFHPKEFYEEMWKEIKSGNEWRGEIKNIKKDKSTYWERGIIIPIKNDNGEIYSFLALKEDITQSKKQAELIQYQAERDSLTGIYNRRAGLNMLESIIEAAKINNEEMVLCFIDLNNLKYTNDNFGHEKGDEMIRIFSKLVKTCLRADDIFFRFGGDEFIIIFKNSRIEITESIWSRIIEAFSEENKFNKKEYLLSASHGICKYDKDKYMTVEEFIKCADAKMYEEKRKLKETNKSNNDK